MEEIKMKDSGIKWIGKIPEDWDIKKIKYCCDTIGSGTTPDSANLEYYENGIYNWIQSGDLYQTEYIEKTEKKITQKAVKDSMSLKLYKKDFLVIAMYGASVGNVAISKINGYVNQACCALNSKNNNIKYIFYNIKAANKYLIDMAFGGTQPNISQIIIKNTPIVLPSRKEQDKIVNFLDKKCADIDEIISKTEKQIESLEQYKDSLITEVITKGLNRNLKYKDSGVQWIGKIPEHWNILKLKYLARQPESLFVDGDWIESDIIEEQGVRYLTTGNVGCGYYKEQGNSYISEETFKKLNCLKVLPNDLMICRLNEPIGRACLAPDTEDKYVVAVDVAILRPDKEHNKTYLMFCMNTKGYADLGKELARGSTMQRVSRTLLGQLLLPIPPREEQEEFAKFLVKKRNKIDYVINKQKESLETLKKYKQSLIYEYVTGKKRV